MTSVDRRHPLWKTKDHQKWRRFMAKGILHQPWHDDFIKYMDAVVAEIGNRPSYSHSVCRIDNNGIIEPGNIRWATISQDLTGRTKSCNH